MAVRGRVRRPNLNLLRALPALRRAAGPELGEVGSGSRRSGGRAGGVARSLTAATKDAVGVALATLRASRVTPAHTRPPCTCFVATIRMDEPFRAGGRGPAPVETPCRLLPAAEWLGVNRGWGGGWGWQGCLVVAGLREGVAGVAGGGTSRLAKTVRACARASHDGDGGLFLLGPFHDDGAPGQARVHYPRARMPRYSNPSRFRGRRDAAQTQRGGLRLRGGGPVVAWMNGPSLL